MDNNNEKTDRFFRERLVVYEEMPDNQVWDKIASRLEAEKRRKIIFLFLRIAAGMTLLASLGLGYHLLYKSGDQKSVTAFTNTATPERPATAPATEQKKTNSSNSQSLPIPDKSGITEFKPHHGNGLPSPIINSVSVPGLSNASFSVNTTGVLTSLNMREATLFSVPVPQRLGYRRLSTEEIQEQTAALIADNNNDKTGEENKDSRWMLGSEVAPLYSYRKIESDYLSKSAVQNMNNSEQGLMAYAGGLRVGYSAGRRLSVQSGLYYSRVGQEKSNGDAVSMDQIAYVDKANMTYLSIPNSTGTIYANNNSSSRYETVIAVANGNKTDFFNSNGFPVSNTQITEGDITAVQYFDYLELPVTVKYKIIDRKLSFSFLGGVITNFLVNNGVQIKQNGNSESFGTTRDINKVNYQGSVGLGFDYPLMDRLAISLEPRFRYYLNPIDQRFNVHPYSFGLFAGISYTLK